MKDIIEPAYEIYVRGYTNAARNLRNMEGDRQSGIKFMARENYKTAVAAIETINDDEY
ncbi:MAG: hypothetical protein IJU73_06375 [Ruminococcus sp.]|nr:hypothetical protein [Ruminococcus sp.]